jgi:DNA polymerase-3 subunit delta
MLYVFHGPDDFIRAEKIDQLKAALGDSISAGLNVTRLEGQSLTLNDIRHHTDTLPFFVTKRLVVVTNYLSYLTNRPDELQALVDYLPHLPESADLVFDEKDTLDGRHPVLRMAQAGGSVLFAGLDPNNLQPWVVKRAKELNATIEPGAAAMLGRLVGPRLRILNSELEKLSLYVNGERAISAADVELLVPYTEEAEKFGMSNAIGKRDARRAYDQLHKELDEGRNPMAIMGSIAAQIRALIEVKDMAERGLSPAEIARDKGWRSDYAAKARLQEAANFSMARLEQILEMLLEIDIAIKTGKIDNMLALDTLIARLCTAR